MINIPKHKPPSRIRYEKSHPTVSLRLDRELKKRLKKELEGKSFADFVKEGLGVRERERKSLKEEYRSGYWQGYGDAQKKFAVEAPCAICGEIFSVYHEEDKEELTHYIKSQKWSHARCRKREREYRR